MEGLTLKDAQEFLDYYCIDPLSVPECADERLLRFVNETRGEPKRTKNSQLKLAGEYYEQDDVDAVIWPDDEERLGGML